MLEWIQGRVIEVQQPKKDDPFEATTLDVLDEEQGYLIRGVQTPVTVADQSVPTPGSTVLIYRDSTASYKYVLTVNDPRPVTSPIKDATAKDIIDTGEITFEPGERAFQAAGTDKTFIPTPGGTLWLKNSGDALLSSGSKGQCISANDSTESIDIEGSNIEILATGNEIATHSFELNTSVTGFTSSTWGVKNPLTGIFTSGIDIPSTGSINIGTFDPVLGVLISGFGFNNLTKFTSVLSVRHSITAANIALTGITSITGTTSITGATSVTGIFSVTGATTLTGVLSASGLASFTGGADIQGGLAVQGATSLAGVLSVVGATSFLGPIFVGIVPGITGVATAAQTVTFVNGIATLIT